MTGLNLSQIETALLAKRFTGMGTSRRFKKTHYDYEAEMSDYKKMLTVYMRHVVEDCGETYLNGFENWARKYRVFDELTDEEIIELNEISEEVSDE